MSSDGKRAPTSTSWKPGETGNPGGRPRGVERWTREQIESYTIDDPDLGTLTGWQAVLRRQWKIAVFGEDKDATPAAKFLFDRGYGHAKQTVVIDENPDPVATIDWSKVPLEQRERLLGALDEIELLTANAGDTEH